MTPKELDYALEAYNDMAELKEKQEYERLRITLMHHWNMQNRYVKHQYKKPTELLEFSWDEKKRRPQTFDEMRNQMQSIANAYKRKKK